MSNVDKNIVAGVKLRTDRPTTVNVEDLFGWVIWQFPRVQKAGYCGAVHPPSDEHAWIPALIQPDKDRIKVYWNVNQTYATPEEAADVLYDDDER